jgi:hypothetical protein
MTGETIVAVYDTAAEADAAVRDLKAADVPADAIRRRAETPTGNGAMTGAAAPAREQGFWASLFGAERITTPRSSIAASRAAQPS